MKTTAYMALMGLAQGRNEAAHALVSAATNLEDAFGCPGSNWGNTAEEHAESNCIFNKLSNGHDEIGYKVDKSAYRNQQVRSIVRVAPLRVPRF